MAELAPRARKAVNYAGQMNSDSGSDDDAPEENPVSDSDADSDMVSAELPEGAASEAELYKCGGCDRAFPTAKGLRNHCRNNEACSKASGLAPGGGALDAPGGSGPAAHTQRRVWARKLVDASNWYCPPKFDDGSQILNVLPDEEVTYGVDIVKATSTTWRVVVTCCLCDEDVCEVAAGTSTRFVKQKLGKHHNYDSNCGDPQLRACRHLRRVASHCLGRAARLAPPEPRRPPLPVRLPELPAPLTEVGKMQLLLATARDVVARRADVRNAASMAGVGLGSACAAVRLGGEYLGYVVFRVDLRGKTRLLIGDEVLEAVLPDNTPLQMLCDRENLDRENHFFYLDWRTGRFEDLSEAVLIAGHGQRTSDNHIVERMSRSSMLLRVLGPNRDLRWCGPGDPISNLANATGQPWFSWQDPKIPGSDLFTAKQILDDVANRHPQLRDACAEQWELISSRGF